MPDPETPVKPAEKEPEGEAAEKAEKPEEKEVDLDGPLDEERARETIKKQREAEARARERAKKAEARLKELEPLAQKAKEQEEANKSETEKLSERLTAATKERDDAKADAARLRVALEKGLTATQAKRLVGEDEEALRKDADELLADFKGSGDGDKPSGRPRERLKTGTAPDAESGDTDPRKLAQGVSRSY